MTVAEYQKLLQDRPDLELPPVADLSIQCIAIMYKATPEEIATRRAAVILRRMPGVVWSFDPMLEEYDPK